MYFNRFFVSVLIGLTILSWVSIFFVSAALAGKEVSINDLFGMSVPYGLIVTAVSFLLWVWECYTWHWPPFVWFTKKPYIQGTWRGTLHSNYERYGQTADSIPVIVVIRQTYNTISIRQFTKESASKLIGSELVIEKDDTPFITGVYINKPKQEFRERSAIHNGALVLNIIGEKRANELQGEYWTDRVFPKPKYGIINSRGSLILKEYLPQKFTSFDEANEAFESEPSFIAKILLRFGYVRRGFTYDQKEEEE